MIALEAAKIADNGHPSAEATFSQLAFDLIKKIEQPDLMQWAKDNIKFSSKDTSFDRLMKIQQLRMIANQSVTVLDLKRG